MSMMRLLVLVSVLTALASAQNPVTANYPNTVVTDEHLLVAKRLSQSTLSSTITSGTLTIAVADGTAFLNYELIRIDNEELRVCTVSSNTLTICASGRGVNGTTASTHSAGASVLGVISSLHHNSLAAELKALLADFTPILFANFPGTCVANKTKRMRADPATAGQVVYVCNAAGNGFVLAGDGGTSGAMMGANNLTDVASAVTSRNNIGAAAQIHTHVGSDITGGSVAVNRGGTSIDTTGLTGMVKLTAGVPSAVSGSATDCVLVNGSSAVCGSGGSNLRPEEVVTAATYTFDTGDCDKHIIFNRSSAIAATLPNPTTFTNGCSILVKNIGVGNAAIATAGAITLNGTAANSITLGQGNHGAVITNATGWQSFLKTGFGVTTSGLTVGYDYTFDRPTIGMEFEGIQFALIPNAGTTGTTLNRLAKVDASGNAVVVATTDTTGAVGVVGAGAGTTGSASVYFLKYSFLVSEGNTTAGHYIGLSAVTAGTGTSSAVCPTTQNVGIWLASGSGSASRLAMMGNFCGGPSLDAALTALAGGSDFVRFIGPTGSIKDFTLPNASSTILTSNAAVTVPQGGTGIASGTSGGVPYFSASTTVASSAALTANLPVIGGGAGAAPAVGTRSGNTTAFVTTTGTQTSGRCVEIDASGNHIAAAAGCSTGGSTTIGFEHTRTTSTKITVAVGQLSSGSVIFTTTSTCDFDVTASTSTATLRTYIDEDGVLTGAYTSGVTITGTAGCTVIPGTAFPDNATPLYEIPLTTVQGQYNTLTAAMDKRASINRNIVVVGDGLLQTIGANGVRTNIVDATQIPRFFTGSGAPSGACTTGRDFYTRTSNADLYKCNGSVWVLQGGGAATDPWTTIDYTDHFVSGNANTDPSGAVSLLGVMNWKLFQSGGGLVTLSNADQSATRNGIVRMSTSANSGGFGGLFTSMVSRTSFHIASTFDMRWAMKIDQTDANFDARLGVSCEAGGGYAPNNMPLDGVYFEKAGADTSWYGVGTVASTDTRSTAVAATDTSWHDFRMWRSDASTISFSIDGGTARTVATNLPTSGCVLGIYITNLTAADKIMSLDKFRLIITGQ